MQSATPWPCVSNFLCLTVTALWYFDKVQLNFYIYVQMCLLLTAVSRTVTQLYTYDTVTCMCSKPVKNFEILVCPVVTQYIKIQVLTN